MADDVVLQAARPIHLAAVRRQVPPGGVAAAWRPALDLVWAFLRGRDGLWTGGHNVFVYRRPVTTGDPLTVDFGVQVVGQFDGDGVVEHAQTPAGRVVTARHVGPIDRLHDTYVALETWCVEHGEVFAGVSWETYGDWGDDPATFEVWVTYLLSDVGQGDRGRSPAD